MDIKLDYNFNKQISTVFISCLDFEKLTPTTIRVNGAELTLDGEILKVEDVTVSLYNVDD